MNHEDPFVDDRCSEKAVRYWQIASMVVEEVGEARTINLMPAVLQPTVSAAGQAAVKFVAMETSSGKEECNVEGYGKCWEMNNLCEECGSTLPSKGQT